MNNSNKNAVKHTQVKPAQPSGLKNGTDVISNGNLQSTSKSDFNNMPEGASKIPTSMVEIKQELNMGEQPAAASAVMIAMTPQTVSSVGDSITASSTQPTTDASDVLANTIPNMAALLSNPDLMKLLGISTSNIAPLLSDLPQTLAGHSSQPKVQSPGVNSSNVTVVYTIQPPAPNSALATTEAPSTITLKTEHAETSRSQVQPVRILYVYIYIHCMLSSM